MRAAEMRASLSFLGPGLVDFEDAELSRPFGLAREERVVARAEDHELLDAARERSLELVICEP